MGTDAVCAVSDGDGMFSITVQLSNADQSLSRFQTIFQITPNSLSHTSCPKSYTA